MLFRSNTYLVGTFLELEPQEKGDGNVKQRCDSHGKDKEAACVLEMGRQRQNGNDLLLFIEIVRVGSRQFGDHSIQRRKQIEPAYTVGHMPAGAEHECKKSHQEKRFDAEEAHLCGRGAKAGRKFLFVSKEERYDLGDVKRKSPRYSERLEGGITIVWGYC